MWSDQIRTIPDFPKPGILFRDITPVFADAQAFSELLDVFETHVGDATHIAGIEARGFIIGAALAQRINLPFVVIRKAGKLPCDTVSESYALEYGEATIELDASALSPSDRVLIVDDLLATGGSALAAISLVEQLGASVSAVVCAIDLPDIGGSTRLRGKGYRFDSLVEFKGE
jgi:adenine phosphoribosyltransferase